MILLQLLRTMAVYHRRRRVLHQHSLNLLQLEPCVSLLSAVNTTPLEGVDLQGPDKAILFDFTSQ